MSPERAAELHSGYYNGEIVAMSREQPTEVYDRGVKLQRYRAIESLQDYILVAQDPMRSEQYTRGEASVWTFRDDQDAAETLRTESIGIALSSAGIYERIELPAELY